MVKSLSSLENWTCKIRTTIPDFFDTERNIYVGKKSHKNNYTTLTTSPTLPPSFGSQILSFIYLNFFFPCTWLQAHSGLVEFQRFLTLINMFHKLSFEIWCTICIYFLTVGPGWALYEPKCMFDMLLLQPIKMKWIKKFYNFLIQINASDS